MSIATPIADHIAPACTRIEDGEASRIRSIAWMLATPVMLVGVVALAPFTVFASVLLRRFGIDLLSGALDD